MTHHHSATAASPDTDTNASAPTTTVQRPNPLPSSVRSASRREIRAYAAVALVVVLLLVVLTGTDRAVSDALASQDSLFGTAFQTFGEFPPAFLSAACTQVIACWLARGLTRCDAWRRAGLVGAVGVLGLLGFLSIWRWSFGMVGYLGQWRANAAEGLPIGAANNDGSAGSAESEALQALLVALVVFILLAAVVWQVLARLTEAQLRAVVIAALVALLVVWGSYVMNTELKRLGGRYRPYEVAAEEGPFSSWLHSNLPNGHHSFPSGHTREGTMLAGWAILVLPFGLRKAQWVLWLGAAYGAAMALSRVLVGAHWSSDTVASFGLTFALVVLGMSAARRLLAPPEAGLAGERGAAAMEVTMAPGAASSNNECGGARERHTDDLPELSTRSAGGGRGEY